MIYIYIISIFYIILYAYLQNLSDSSGLPEALCQRELSFEKRLEHLEGSGRPSG